MFSFILFGKKTKGCNDVIMFNRESLFKKQKVTKKYTNYELFVSCGFASHECLNNNI